MTSQRVERVNEMIRQDVAAGLFRIINDADFDHAAVTVTHVLTTPDLRQSKIFVSVRGDDAKKADHLRRLTHYRKEFQASLAKHVVMKYTPHLRFELDGSIARGDSVLDLINKIEHEHPDWVEPKSNDES